MTDAETYNELYAGTYSRDEAANRYKFHLAVEPFIETIPPEHLIYDIGSGRGFYTNEALKMGQKVFAVDWSDVLDDYKAHPNLETHKADVLDFLKGATFDPKSAVLCMDFLEHVSIQDIEKVVESLSKLSPRALYGVANHPDLYKGNVLHSIIEPKDWWVELLERYYDPVFYIETKFDDRFFFLMAESFDNG